MYQVKLFKSTDESNGYVPTKVPFVIKQREKDLKVCIKGNKKQKVIKSYDDELKERCMEVTQYMTIESLEDGTTVYLFKRANPLIERNVNLEYSLDNGETWNTYTLPGTGENGESITINLGEKVLFKGDNPEGFNECYYNNKYINNLAYYFLGTGKYKVSGNVMSLIYKDNFIDKNNTPNKGCFSRLFQGNTALIEVYNLCLPEPTNDGYEDYCIFIECTNLQKVTLDYFPKSLQSFYYYNSNQTLEFNINDSKNVNNMVWMFYLCSNLESIGDISNWDVSKVTAFKAMFQLCSKLESIGDLSGWNVGSCTDMSWMFYKCSKLESIGDISNWDVSKVTTFEAMFWDCVKLESIGDLSGWNVGSCTDMSSMFGGYNDYMILKSIGDISNWDVSKVTTFDAMFQKCSKLESIGDLSGWNVGSCTDMSYMFNKCSNLESIGDISNWDVSKVTTFRTMFQLCSKLESIGDLSGWNVGSCTDMSWMFNQCSNLESIGDISNWDVSKVTTFERMFRECYKLSPTLCKQTENWDVSSCLNFTDMFHYIGNNEYIEDTINLNNWKFNDSGDPIYLSRLFHYVSFHTIDMSEVDFSHITQMQECFVGSHVRIIKLGKNIPDETYLTNIVNIFVYAFMVQELHFNAENTPANCIRFMKQLMRTTTKCFIGEVEYKYDSSQDTWVAVTEDSVSTVDDYDEFFDENGISERFNFLPEKEGYKYYNGSTVLPCVCLPKDDDISSWKLITDEEANSMSNIQNDGLQNNTDNISPNINDNILQADQ